MGVRTIDAVVATEYSRLNEQGLAATQSWNQLHGNRFRLTHVDDSGALQGRQGFSLGTIAPSELAVLSRQVQNGG